MTSGEDPVQRAVGMDGDESGGGGGGALVTRRRSSAARPPQVNATATRPWAATPVTTPSPKGVSTAFVRALFGDAGDASSGTRFDTRSTSINTSFGRTARTAGLKPVWT